MDEGFARIEASRDMIEGYLSRIKTSLKAIVEFVDKKIRKIFLKRNLSFYPLNLPFSYS